MLCCVIIFISVKHFLGEFFSSFTGSSIKIEIIIQADMYYKLYKNICGNVKSWILGNH